MDWRPIPLLNIEVSNTALVRHLKTHHIYKPFKVCKGRYLGIKLTVEGKRTTYNLHSLVTLAWFGKTPDGQVIDHKDNDRYNNAVENLHYISQAENVQKYFSWKEQRELQQHNQHLKGIVAEAQNDP